MAGELLRVDHVTKVFGQKNKKQTVAMQDVCLTLYEDQPITIAVVGESGSGKTTLANQVLGFQKPTKGRILYKGKDIHTLGRAEMAEYRREVQAVFQNPFEAFNPFYPVDHVFKVVISKFGLAKDKQEAAALVDKVLRQVRLEPEQVLGKHSHQLSGGQLQRIMIARALLLRPTVLIADEPVSMIDASLRITVLDIMEKLKRDNEISQIYITHDLSTALQISDTILVMYHGWVVESGRAADVIEAPSHPYTQLLINCIPLPSPDEKWEEPVPVASRKGEEYPSRCCFYDRCPEACDDCLAAQPGYAELGGTHKVACLRRGDSRSEPACLAPDS